MKRIVMMVSIVLAVGVGTYARGVLTQDQTPIEPIQKGAIYKVGFCTTSMGLPQQYIRVVRELSRGWVEVELEGSLQGFDPAVRARDPYMRGPIRLNLNAVCFLTPATP